uniref:RING-type domain-containing protein n=1 Tax=viral metagenome TaxID=1070528 RepID=A0A6C0HY15_9ZZZZ
MSYIQFLCMNFHKLIIQSIQNIQSIQSIKYNKITNIIENCPVCNKEKNIIILECGHSVCKDCIITSSSCILCSLNNIMERL